MSARDKNIEVMLQIFSAIEQRDAQRVLGLVHPDVEFHWPPSLPYGGTRRGLNPDGPTWGKTWDPLQPTASERHLDPRVIAATDEEVVVHWRQKGVTPSGDRIDTPVLGLYLLRDGKLARAQMFYFDPAAVLSFLLKATGQAAAAATP
jgi:ketosteroid isomerase-like protein